MSLELLREWGPVLFAGAANLLLAWLSTKFASKRDVDLARQSAFDAHHRIDLVEKDIKGLPDFTAVNGLREAVGRLDRHLAERNGDVKALGVRVEGIDDKIDRQCVTVDRIEQHILNQSRP